MKTFGCYSGFGDIASDLSSATDASTVSGLKAINSFWRAAMLYNTQLPTDFPTFLTGLENAMAPLSADTAFPGYVGPYFSAAKQDTIFKAMVSGIGDMVNTGASSSAWSDFKDLVTGSSTPNVAAFSDSDVDSAMSALAKQGGGRIPLHVMDFGNFLINQGTQVGFFDALWYLTVMTAAAVTQGVEQVGNTALAVGQGALNAVNTFAQYETYFIAGGLALAAYLAYTIYVPHRRNPISRKKRRASYSQGSGNSPTRTATKTANTGKSGNSPTSTRAITVTQGASGGAIKITANPRKRKKNPCMTGIDGDEVCF